MQAITIARIETETHKTIEKETNYYKQISMANAHLLRRECSLQEAAYHIMPESCLRKTFSRVLSMIIGKKLELL